MSVSVTSQRRRRCAGRVEEPLGPLARRGVGRRPEGADRPEREEELLLGGEELGAVDVGEDLALPDVLPGEVGGDVLDVGLEPRVDVVDPPLVVGDAADGPDPGPEGTPLDLRGPQREELALAGVDRHRREARDARLPDVAPRRARPPSSRGPCRRSGSSPCGPSRSRGASGRSRSRARRPARPAAPSFRTSRIPQIGQSPSWSFTISGCIGQRNVFASAGTVGLPPCRSPP